MAELLTSEQTAPAASKYINAENDIAFPALRAASAYFTGSSASVCEVTCGCQWYCSCTSTCADCGPQCRCTGN